MWLLNALIIMGVRGLSLDLEAFAPMKSLSGILKMVEYGVARINAADIMTDILKASGLMIPV
jgi:hypothetical protein